VNESVYSTGFFEDVADLNPGTGTANVTSKGVQDIYVAKLNSAGIYQWSYAMGSPGYDQGRAIAIDPACSLYVAGTFQSTVDFNPSSPVFDLTAGSSSSDGFIQTFKYRHLEDFSPTQNENLFDLYYSICYQDLPQKFPLLIADSKGHESTIEITSLDWTAYQKFYRDRNPLIPALEYRAVNRHVYYLAVNSFHEQYRQAQKQDFKKLFDEIFTQLGHDKVENLILDLRKCEGGDNSYIWLLSYLMNRPFRIIDYLEAGYSGLPASAKYFENTDSASLIDSMLYRTPSGMYRLKTEFESTVLGYRDITPEPKAFNGKIFVLTSGATGSAAGVVATILRNSKRAVFVGEETGSAMEGPTSLNISTLILPHTKIRVEIPHIRQQLAVRFRHGRGVVPDHLIETTPKDLRDGGDPQLEYTLRLIKQ
jgi:hypothetical protein